MALPQGVQIGAGWSIGPGWMLGGSGPLTIATNDAGGLTGCSPQSLAILYSPTVISDYPVGSTIRFQDNTTATITAWDPYAPNYIDLFWDTPKTGTLFPITLST